jgi:hypothetical protein
MSTRPATIKKAKKSKSSKSKERSLSSKNLKTKKQVEINTSANKINSTARSKPLSSSSHISNTSTSFSNIKALIADDQKDFMSRGKTVDDYQFYSFTHNKFVSSDDLVAGGYVGADVVDVKKAANRIREDIAEASYKIKKKVIVMNEVEDTVAQSQKHLNRTVDTMKAKIIKQIDEIRKHLNDRERILIVEADTVLNKKQAEFEEIMKNS